MMNFIDEANRLKVAPSSANICAVVVSFHPDESFTVRLSTLTEQVKRIIIVDNSRDKMLKRNISNLSQVAKIELIENSTNVGVATALNQGVRAALQQSFKWVLTLDQDTVPFRGMVELLCNAFAAYPKPETVGVIGSSYEGMRGGSVNNLAKYVAEPTVITAGSLIPVTAFQKVGGFRDDLFIDGVDEDFCLRVQRAGFTVLRATTIGISQAIGAQTRRRFFWRDVGVSNHPAFRHYYMTRNRLVLIGNHFLFDPVWAMSQIATQVKMIAFVILFETNKSDKLLAMFKGFAHALLGKRGKVDSPQPNAIAT